MLGLSMWLSTGPVQVMKAGAKCPPMVSPCRTRVSCSKQLAFAS